MYTQYKYMHACTHTCTFMYINIYMCIHAYKKPPSSQSLSFVLKYIRVYKFLCIYVCTHNIHTYSLTYMHLCIHTQYSHIFVNTRIHTGWRRPIGCLILWITFRKLALIIGLFCGKRPRMIRHPMSLCHPVNEVPIVTA